MSQQQDGQGQQQQSNVRVIPIFVEGRDEPVINRDFPDSGPQVHHHHHEPPPPPRMPQPDLDFGREIPTGFRHGSIFDRAKDFPVRSMRDEFFRDRMSPSRGESPLRNVPVNHMFNEPQLHRFGRGPSPQPQERQRTSSGSYEQPQRKRTSSRNEDHPVVPPPPQQPSQTAAAPPPKQQPQQAPSQPTAPPTAVPTAVPPKEATPPPPSKPKLGPIEKIQQIQKDVLDLMTKVEQFEGKGKRDKYYLYLDEMLTQNLLKLDTVDTDGQENVKLARKEAVKCINRCLSVLEAKAEANELAGPTTLAESQSGDQMVEKSSSTVQAEIEHQPSNGEQQVAEGQEPTKQSSRGSIYDNHDESAEPPAPEPPTKESTPKPKSKESTPAPAVDAIIAPEPVAATASH